jgi:hypothetical protein
LPMSRFFTDGRRRSFLPFASTRVSRFMTSRFHSEGTQISSTRSASAISYPLYKAFESNWIIGYWYHAGLKCASGFKCFRK